MDLSSLFRLLMSAMNRLTAAIKSPFRMLLIKGKRMFNINVITGKLVKPMTKKVRGMLVLKPESRQDYYVVGKFWIYKKLFLAIVVAICAAVFFYFTMFAPKISTTKVMAEAVKTTVTYDYNDLKLAEFSGIANIRANDGKIVYTGAIDKGVCTGEGTLRDRDGNMVYQGTFKENRYNGNGVKFYPSGKPLYEGAFLDNLYHGEGTLYDGNGLVYYKGFFQNGKFSGLGIANNGEGKLIYEGSFQDGLYHGDGTLFFEDGIMRYKGAFYQGKPQGVGSIYSKAGKLLYTGDVYDGLINYQSLVNSNLADVEKAFEETPKIFYSDQGTVLVYEQSGVMVTIDARVRLSEWEQKDEEGTTPTDMYYLPENPILPDIMDISIPSLPYDVPPENLIFPSDSGISSSSSSNAGSSSSISSSSSSSSMSSSAPLEEGMIGYVPGGIGDSAGSRMPDPGTPEASRNTIGIFEGGEDPTGGTGLLPTSANSTVSVAQLAPAYAYDSVGFRQLSFQSASSTVSSSNSDSSVSSTVSSSNADAATSSSNFDSSVSSSASVSSSSTESSIPVPSVGQDNVYESSSNGSSSDTALFPGVGNREFIEKQLELFYEIDSNVWQSEKDLDKTKVQVKKVTIYRSPLIDLPVEGSLIDDNDPPAIEDCVAIDYLRQASPTAFAHMNFQMDKQNRLFVRVYGINLADRVYRRTYLWNDLTYRFVYGDNQYTEALYFSVER